LLAVAGLLAACGGDDKSAASSSTATTSGTSASGGAATTAATTPVTTIPAPTGSPLKLALVVDQTGPSSNGQGVAVDVAKAWVAYANSHGGVAGHPVAVDVKDTKGDAPTGQSFASALGSDTSVIGALLVDSAGESTYAKSISDGGLPVVGGLGYYPTVWAALKNVFGITTQFPAVVNEQVIAAQKVNSKGVGVAACAEIDSCAAAAPIFEAAAKKAGIPYAGLVKIANSATSFTAECLQFIKKGADYIQLSAGGAVGQRMYDDCAQQGFTGYVGASAGTVNASLYKGSDIRLTGGLNAFPWWVDDAPVKQFRAVMDSGNVSVDK
jgi:branched-chain amino acid transport system substrate-binding protein